jgi:hypothetical protein
MQYFCIYGIGFHFRNILKGEILAAHQGIQRGITLKIQ